MNYATIKKLAREIQCSVTDLLALAALNDPFYSECPHRAEAGQWFAVLWDRFNWRHGVHLRRLHYVLISQDPPVMKPTGKPYQNTENDWKYLGIASLAARYMKLVPPDALVDRRNPDPIINAKFDRHREPCHVAIVSDDPNFGYIPDELRFPDFHLRSFSAEQDYLLEIWVEKSTQNDILAPLGRRLGFNLITGVGEMSETAARNAVGRALDAGKPLHIIYVSDFDPGGRSMPVALARKIEWTIRAAELDVDVTLDPLVLTPEQVDHYHLPRTPIREGERRALRFEARFGEGAVELDALEALHPGELARLVEEAVTRYLDPTLERRVAATERDLERELDGIRERIVASHLVDDIRARFEEIRQELQELEEEAAESWNLIAARLEIEQPPIAPEDVPTPRAADPVEAPLFDSRRDYFTQIDAYRAWQGRGGGT